MERILLLTEGVCWKEISEMLHSAKRTAQDNAALSYGFCLSEEPELDEQKEMASLGSVLFVCSDHSPWRAFHQLWQGEELVLVAGAGMRFLRGWDRMLRQTIKRLKKNDAHAAALTGFPPCPADQLFAMRAVAAGELDEDFRLHFCAGVPIRYAAAPVPSFFLNPGFCFGFSAFFRRMEERPSIDFLQAQAQGESLYTLHQPVCTAGYRNEILPADLSRVSVQDEILCRRAGISLEKRLVEPMAREGIGYPDLKYPLRIPGRDQLEGVLVPRSRGRRSPTPMCVTAYVTGKGTLLPDDQVRHFRLLTAVREAPVLCYADAASARRVMLLHPNVMEYKPQYALRVDRRVGLVDADNYARLCRPFLLAQAMERLLTNSHYVWIDFDYLSYPVYEREHISWELLCANQITMATVGGVPDTSMIVVPDHRIQPLCREIIMLCDAEARSAGVLPEETALWQTLIRLHPDWFDLIELPGKRELFGLAIRSVHESWVAIDGEE